MREIQALPAIASMPRRLPGRALNNQQFSKALLYELQRRGNAVPRNVLDSVWVWALNEDVKAYNREGREII